MYLFAINIIDYLRDIGTISKKTYRNNILILMTILRIGRFMVDVIMSCLFLYIFIKYLNLRSQRNLEKNEKPSLKEPLVILCILMLFSFVMLHAIILLYETIILLMGGEETLHMIDFLNFMLLIFVPIKDALISLAFVSLYYF